MAALKKREPDLVANYLEFNSVHFVVLSFNLRLNVIVLRIFCLHFLTITLFLSCKTCWAFCKNLGGMQAKK